MLVMNLISLMTIGKTNKYNYEKTAFRHFINVGNIIGIRSNRYLKVRGDMGTS